MLTLTPLISASGPSLATIPLVTAAKDLDDGASIRLVSDAWSSRINAYRPFGAAGEPNKHKMGQLVFELT